MLKKKLLTMAGVLGILACGACFLPPVRERPPTPVPELAGIHTIRVEVTEKVNPGHLNVDRLARAAARELNDEAAKSGITAETGSGPADAVLAIEVINETSSQSMVHGKPVANSWHFMFIWNATLTTPDGTIHWQAKSQLTQFEHRFSIAPIGDPWNDRAVSQEAADMFRVSIAPNLLFGIR